MLLPMSDIYQQRITYSIQIYLQTYKTIIVHYLRCRTHQQYQKFLKKSVKGRQLAFGCLSQRLNIDL